MSIAATGSPGRGDALRRDPRHGRAVAFAAVVEGRAVEVRGVAPADQGEALAGIEQAVDRGIAELPRARRAEVNSRGGAIEAVEHAAVADDERRAAARRRCDSRHRGDGAVVELDQAFAAFGRERRVVAAPARRLVGPARVDLGVGVTFEDAEAALAQASIGRDRQAEHGGDRGGGVVSARQIAGDDRLDALAGERLGGARRLPTAALAERGVQLALHPHLGVPDRLAVAHGDDSRRLARRRARVAPHDRSSRRLSV